MWAYAQQDVVKRRQKIKTTHLILPLVLLLILLVLVLFALLLVLLLLSLLLILIILIVLLVLAPLVVVLVVVAVVVVVVVVAVVVLLLLPLPLGLDALLAVLAVPLELLLLVLLEVLDVFGQVDDVLPVVVAAAERPVVGARVGRAKAEDDELGGADDRGGLPLPSVVPIGVATVVAVVGIVLGQIVGPGGHGGAAGVLERVVGHVEAEGVPHVIVVGIVGIIEPAGLLLLRALDLAGDGGRGNLPPEVGGRGLLGPDLAGGRRRLHGPHEVVLLGRSSGGGGINCNGRRATEEDGGDGRRASEGGLERHSVFCSFVLYEK